MNANRQSGIFGVMCIMNANLIPQPVADRAEIEKTLATLYPADVVVELRVIHNKGRKHIDAGYFDHQHRNEMIEAAIRANAAGANVYVTLNPIDPQLLGRYNNRLQEFAPATATDNDVTSRRWLLIDSDPVRPKDTAATDEQLKLAKNQVIGIHKFLQKSGWSAPVCAESGNGVHLLYPIDLPNDKAALELIKSVLNALGDRFDTDSVKVDRVVSNAARITKLYGTVSTKGDHTAQTPWRVSRITNNPQRIIKVTPEQLRAIIPPAVKAAAPDISRVQGIGFNLDEFLERLNIPSQKDRHDGRDRYKLDHCPFNPDHGKGEAAIFRSDDGVLGFKCFHNSCADKKWQDVRALIDGSREDWPEPQPLPDELLPVAVFDFSLLPDSLRAWAQDICERVQCPPDFVGAGIMASLAAVVGRKIGIRPQARTDWTVVPNLWALVVGRPGVLKSPALEATLAPLNRLVVKANEEHAGADSEYKKNLAVAKLRAAAGEQAARKKLVNEPNADVLALLAVDEPDEPTLKRYKANDSTPASLGELLRQNSNGLLVYRDELVSLLKGLDREDQAEGRGFYLTAWNGDSPYTFDRIGRGLNLNIEAVCLSILGGTQPGRLAEYIRHAVKGGAADDGLIQRFGLLVWPDTGGPWKDVDRWPDTDAKNQAFKVFDYIDKLDLATIGAEQDTDLDGNPDGIPYLRFDAGGLELFLEWRTDLETRLRGGDLPPALESHFAKYRKLIPALALIIHLADEGIGPVTEKATLQALAWGAYLETHAHRAYGAISQPDVATAKAILSRVKKGDLPASFSSRDVWRPSWAKLSDSEQVANGLRLLVDYGHLREERKETAGRPSTTYHVTKGGRS